MCVCVCVCVCIVHSNIYLLNSCFLSSLLLTVMFQGSLSITNYLHTVLWFQIHLSITKLYTIIWINVI